MNQIENVIDFAKKRQAREARIDAFVAKVLRNPMRQLVTRIDDLQLASWDVKYRTIRKDVEVARLPDDNLAFLFFKKPENPPPKAG